MQFIRSRLEKDDLEIRQLKQINNERLQNAFEDIIEKYAQDFTEYGDEIDLESGEIIVNNGHLERMRNEQDTGDKRHRLLTNIVNEVHRPLITPTTHIRATMYRQSHSQYQLREEDEEVEEEWEDLDELSPERDRAHRPTSPVQTMSRHQRIQSGPAIDDGYSNYRTEPRSYTPQNRTPRMVDRRPSAIPAHIRSYDRAESRPYQQHSPSPFTPAAATPAPQTSPNVNREMIREFAQNIASQITEFMFYFAGSMQQPQHQPPPSMPQRNTPSYGRSNQPATQVSDTYDHEENMAGSRPPKRRRTLDAPSRQISHPQSEPATASRSQPKAPPNRLNTLRSEPGETPSRSQHGHRGVTPGMPSLWSGEEDSDYVPPRSLNRAGPANRIHNQVTKTNNISRPQLQSGSRLRNEVRVDSEQPAAVEVKSSPSKRPVLSSAVRKVLVSPPKARPMKQIAAAESYARDEMDLLPDADNNDDEHNPIILDSEDDEFMSIHNEDDEYEEIGGAQGRTRPSSYHRKYAFTEEHDRLIVKLRENGNSWPAIADQLPHSASQVMYRYKTYLMKGIHPGISARKAKELATTRNSGSNTSKSPKDARMQQNEGLSEEYDPEDEDYVEPSRSATKRASRPARAQGRVLDLEDEEHSEPTRQTTKDPHRQTRKGDAQINVAQNQQTQHAKQAVPQAQQRHASAVQQPQEATRPSSRQSNRLAHVQEPRGGGTEKQRPEPTRPTSRHSNRQPRTQERTLDATGGARVEITVPAAVPSRRQTHLWEQVVDDVDELMDERLKEHRKPKSNSGSAITRNSAKEGGLGSPTLLSGLEVPPASHTKAKQSKARVDEAATAKRKVNQLFIDEIAPDPSFRVNPQKHIVDARKIKPPNPIERSNWKNLANRSPPYFVDDEDEDDLNHSVFR